MDNTALRAYLNHIIADAQGALALVPTDSVLVRAGENLQAALDVGGNIGLEDGAIFPGNFIMKKAGTRLLGPKAGLAGPNGGPALSIPPGTKDVKVTLATAVSAWDQRVIMVGDNDPAVQSKPEQVPDGVEITCFVPKHRGKTAFWINGKNVKLINCGCADTWDPASRDSQGISILNTPGPVYVSGGTFEAGSENIMVGGDTTGIPDVQPTGIVFEDITCSRPLSWKTDGVNRKVKCLFELKAGIDVVLRRAKLSGCWVNSQVGWCFMLTPRDGKQVKSCLFEDCTVTDVGGGISMLGYDNIIYPTVVARPNTQDMTFRRVNVTARKDFGTGRFAQWEAEPQRVVIDDCTFEGPDTTIYSAAGTCWDSPTVKREGGVCRGIRVTNNHLAHRGYGISTGTVVADGAYAYGQNWQQAWPDGVISGNTFIVPSLPNLGQKFLPTDNKWVVG